MIKVIRLGGLYDKGKKHHERGSIYDIKGISPPLDTCKGGNGMPLVLVRKNHE